MTAKTLTAEEWNDQYPVGTPVHAWPGTRDAEPMWTTTRTPAWTLGHGAVVVSVVGATGGIALTHVDVRGTLEEALDSTAATANRILELPPGYRLVWAKDAS